MIILLMLSCLGTVVFGALYFRAESQRVELRIKYNVSQKTIESLSTSLDFVDRFIESEGFERKGDMIANITKEKNLFPICQPIK